MDKFYALLGMLGNTGNDLIFKVTAKQQEGRSIASFYLLALLSGMAITFALFFTFTAFKSGMLRW